MSQALTDLNTAVARIGVDIKTALADLAAAKTNEDEAGEIAATAALNAAADSLEAVTNGTASPVPLVGTPVAPTAAPLGGSDPASAAPTGDTPPSEADGDLGLNLSLIPDTATVGQVFSGQAHASGGIGDLSYDITPQGDYPGMSTAGALIVGTPTQVGPMIFDVVVTDSVGNHVSGVKTVVVS